MATYYKPSDGDFIAGKEEEYSKFIDVLQEEAGYDFGEYPEICVSLEESGMIRILGADEECDAWEWDQLFYTPDVDTWTSFQIAEMFEGNVYMQPAARPTKHALDGGDSAPSQTLSTPEVLSPSLSDSASRPAAQ